MTITTSNKICQTGQHFFFLQPIKIPFSSFDPGSYYEAGYLGVYHSVVNSRRSPWSTTKFQQNRIWITAFSVWVAGVGLSRGVYKIREGSSTSVAKAIYYLGVVESVSFAVIIRLSRSGPSALENPANKHYNKQELTSKSVRSPGRCRRQKYWIKNLKKAAIKKRRGVSTARDTLLVVLDIVRKPVLWF